MPEIGEVARIVHYLRKHLVNRTVKTCQAFEDDIVYGKVGCSAKAFQKAIEGKKVTGAGQQGKYFYITFDSPPHSVMHLGMTGWIKFSAEETGYYRQAKESIQKEEWPPKFMKFLLKCEAEQVDGEDRDDVEVAFIDGRRLGRIRLVDCDAGKIRQFTPLKENGPDPVIDKDKLTVGWLSSLMRRKRVPIKALLLDQGNISGVGNWVADEVLYQARIHPEQYSNTFNDKQIQTLHAALTKVCTIACETLADSTQFPEDWLMKYRWDKGKKGGNTLPNGAKIEHITVGGRTSAIVPSVQKKTAAVAGDSFFSGSKKKEEGQSGREKKRKVEGEEEDEEVEAAAVSSKQPNGKKVKAEAPAANTTPSKSRKRERVDAETGEEEGTKPTTVTTPSRKADKPVTPGSRRSTRNRAT